jgi:hypothetical protein
MSGHPDALSRVEFDSTIEEDVDVQIRLACSMTSFAEQRRRQVVGTAFAAAAAGPVGLLLGLGYVPSAVVLLGVIALSVILGAALGNLAGHYFDRRVRRGVRRVVDELYSGAETLHQEIELRPAGLWCRSRGVEMVLPWSRFSRTHDAAEGIELWFSLPALARIPSRAFLSHQHRQEFLAHATMLAAATDKS